MEQEVYQEARRRVKAKAKFYRHLMIFVIINGFLTLKSIFSFHPFHSLPMTFFWGIGLAFHYVKVFGFPGSGTPSESWEEKEMRREVERLKGKTPLPPQREEPIELREIRKNYKDSDLV